jgi:2-keto-4-pentenoate hydratase/2-oxohepta-3-ene-1,7-dioic acid hydratase in catechol pathway
LRIATYVQGGKRQVGVVSPDGQQVTAFKISPDTAQRGALPLIEAFAKGDALPGLEGTAIALASVKLEAPIPQPRRNLWCVGRNYHAHAKELAASVFKDNSANVVEWPIVFTKAPETVIGPTDDVVLPGAAISEQIDYEAELTIVIGKGGKNISKADWRQHVFGYTIINDVTARDLQKRHGQWFKGKSMDTFCPMGPVLVTADEIPDPQALSVAMRINGETRQSSHTSKMIFPVDECIAVLSQGFTVLPGDVIATGTPEGVGAALGKFLKAGDKMEAEVEKIGVLTNKIVAP